MNVCSRCHRPVAIRRRQLRTAQVAAVAEQTQLMICVRPYRWSGCRARSDELGRYQEATFSALVSSTAAGVLVGLAPAASSPVVLLVLAALYFTMAADSLRSWRRCRGFIGSKSRRTPKFLFGVALITAATAALVVVLP